jgi:hypothetical protein
MAEVSKAEILEQMCLLVRPRHTIRLAGQLSGAERKLLLSRKILRAASHNWWKFDLAIYYPCVPSQSILLSNQCFL